MTALLAAVAISLLPSPPPDVAIPIEAFATPELPAVTAEAYVLYDLSGDLELLSHNADEPRAMASVTKLMTALVVLDAADLGDEVVISQSAADTGEAEVGLTTGEVWTVWELLNAIIVRSGNDAATALAEFIGGSVAGFADLMNAKAIELGMVSTSFVNPHGLDADGHFSTANDLVLLARAAYADPVIAQLARTRVVKFRPAPDGDRRRATNTNDLLGAFDGVVGLKTGFTSQAKRVLVSAATRDGRTLICVVMGSEDHFADTRELLEYGFEMYGIADRFAAPLAGEQGGGVTPMIDATEAARLSLLPEMIIVDATASRAPTPLEERVSAALVRLVPPLLTAP
jgi:D-alanyl-D-alanine carboxypeptidase